MQPSSRDGRRHGLQELAGGGRWKRAKAAGVLEGINPVDVRTVLEGAAALCDRMVCPARPGSAVGRTARWRHPVGQPRAAVQPDSVRAERVLRQQQVPLRRQQLIPQVWPSSRVSAGRKPQLYGPSVRQAAAITMARRGRIERPMPIVGVVNYPNYSNRVKGGRTSGRRPNGSSPSGRWRAAVAS